MGTFFKYIKTYKIIYIIIFLFFLTKLLTIFNYKIVWWDSAVYIGMGKYIYSLGSIGLWENSRPILWSLMLGFLWKAGLSPILFGRIVEMIFGSLCILLTYLIGKKLFNEKTALLASLFLALSPTFFFFNGVMLTEIVSTFFALSGVYYFIERKHFVSGLFFGMAFTTRFLQFFVFVPVILISLIYFNKKNIKIQSKIVIGFLIVIIPYLILNYILYNNAFLPFIQQVYLSNNSGWFNYHSLSYYFIELFKENFLYLLFVLGIVSIFRSKDKNKLIVVLVFLLLFLFFNSIKQKEMRFLVILLPYMYLMIASFIINVYDRIKVKNLRYAIMIIILLSFVFSIIKINSYYKEESSKYNIYKELQEGFERHDVKGNIWVSNPIIPILSNNKLANLMYYSTLNETKKEESIKEKSDFIFVDFCDLVCRPNNINCNNNWIELLNFLKNELKMKFSSIKNGCEQFIFQR